MRGRCPADDGLHPLALCVWHSEGKSGEGAEIPKALEAELERLGWPAHLRSKVKSSKHVLDEGGSVTALGRMYRARYGVSEDGDGSVELDEHLRVATFDASCQKACEQSQSAGFGRKQSFSIRKR